MQEVLKYTKHREASLLQYKQFSSIRCFVRRSSHLHDVVCNRHAASRSVVVAALDAKHRSEHIERVVAEGDSPRVVGGALGILKLNDNERGRVWER